MYRVHFFSICATTHHLGALLRQVHYAALQEEAHLRRRYGTAFEEYCAATPRWLL